MGWIGRNMYFWSHERVFEGACGRQGIHTKEMWWGWNCRPCKRRRWVQLAGIFLSKGSPLYFHPLSNVQSGLIKAVSLLKGLLGFAVDSTLCHAWNPSLGLLCPQ